jgi:WD40 repeat protein
VNHDRFPADAGDCPTLGELAAFTVGSLSADRLEPVADHLLGCRRCESALEALHGQADTLVSHLRRAARAESPFLGEPECRLLEARAKANRVDRPLPPSQEPSRETVPMAGEEPALPTKLGPYQVLERLGRGGMGVVYKARQTSLGRLVAVKMLLGPAGGTEARVARFRAEARKLACLRHPNIVAVYETGEDQGRPYFSMEFVDGGSLARQLAEARPAPLRAAELTRQLALAVHYAHQRNIIHRDLKPGNVLLTADGVPKVSDFGLAKSLDEEDGQTESGAILGTPSYMAPEQASGKPRDVGVHTDVYGLGAILYELLTGEPPFRGETRMETVNQVMWQEPVPPSRKLPGVPADLETICLTCLHKDPRKRYPSALALAEDLQRFLDRKPIRARPVSRAERLWAWCRRNPALAAVSSLAGAAVLGLLLVWAMDAVRQSRERRESLLRAANLAFDRGLRRCAEGDVDVGLLWLVRSLESAPEGTKDLARAVRANLAAWHQEQCLLKAVVPQPAEVTRLAVSPDGRTMLAACAGHAPRLWQLPAGREQHALPGPRQEVSAAAFSPDGKRVLTAGDGTARLWDVATGKLVREFPRQDKSITSAAFSRDGRRLLLGLGNQTSLLWTISGKGEIRSARRLPFSRVLAFHPDGARAIAAHEDNSVRLWDLASGEEVRRFVGHFALVGVAVFSSDGRTLLTGSSDHHAALWDVRTGERLHRFPGFDGPVLAVAFGPGDVTVLLSAADRTVHCFDARSGARLKEPLRLAYPVTRSAFGGGGKFLLTTGTDTAVRLWELSFPRVRCLLESDGRIVNKVALSPDGRTALAAKIDPQPRAPGLAHLWDVATGRAVGIPLRHPYIIWDVAFSPDGKHVLTGGSMDRVVRLWEVHTGKLVSEFRGHEPGQAVQAVAFSPDGRTALSASMDGTARLWETSTGLPLGAPLRHGGPVHAIAFGPDGTAVATASRDGTARVWDARTGRPRTDPLPHEGPVQAVAFSPDSKTVLTGSWDHTARLWEARTGRPRCAPLAHRDRVWAVAFSPDGKTVLTGSMDHTARLWDAQTGQQRGGPLLHRNEVRAVAFSPDGRTAFSGSFDGTVRRWDVATGRPVGPPLLHPRHVHHLAVCARTVLSGSEDGRARLWALPGQLSESPDRLKLWVQVHTGLMLDEQGVARPLDAATWRRQQQELEDRGGVSLP